MLNDKFVEGFLSISDSNKFQNLKKEEEKIRKWEQISDSMTFDGKVSSKLSEENKAFLD